MIKKVYNCFITCFCFIFIALCFSCATVNSVVQEPPLWMLNSRNVYPESSYLTYVGYGDSRNNAEIDALNGIASIFGQNVSGTVSSSRRMSEAVVNGKVAVSHNTSINKDITSRVNIDNLIGVEIKDFWLDEQNVWYAIAVLDRKKASEIYSSMIYANSRTVDDLIASADKDFYSVQSMKIYDFAQEIALENKKNLDKLFIIDSNLAQGISKSVILPEDLGKQIIKIANAIPIYISIKGDDTESCVSAFCSALSDFGFSQSLDNNVRYVIKGDVSYNYSASSDGRSVKCYYDLKSSLLDTKNDTSILFININGRQAHQTEEQARQRALSDIKKEIQGSFNKEFSNYLSDFLGN